MSVQKFEKQARKRKKTAIVFSLVFHGLVLGGLMYGSGTSTQLIEKIETLWKGETAAEEVPKAKKKRA